MSTTPPEMANPTGSESAPKRWLALFGLLLLLDLVVAVVMLATDKNLQTDFGATSPYYAHWYGVLAMGALDGLVGIAVLATAFIPSRASRVSMRKWVLRGALGWSILAIAAMVGVVETYQQVGFSSMSQFAQYLFGVTAYPGALSYIPWLYDMLLGCYVVTAVIGSVSVWRA